MKWSVGGAPTGANEEGTRKDTTRLASKDHMNLVSVLEASKCIVDGW